MDAKQVGRKIAQLRKEHNMTQKELASKLNVIDKTISRWECGYGLPDLAIIPQIAAIFNTSIEDLLETGSEASDIMKEAMKAQEQESNVIIGETSLSEDNVPKHVAFIKKHILPIVISASVLILLCILIPLMIARRDTTPPTPEEHLIKDYCWNLVEQSDADYVFITAFGMEECISLELWGDKSSGRFFCQETWRSGTSEAPISCAIYGDYVIYEGKIHFYSSGVIDELLTNKLRLHGSLGLECYTADVEYNADGDIEIIAFKSTVKNTESSVFGRWTKYGHYYSREKGEICFERVGDEISYEQVLKLPTFVAIDMGIVVPYKLEASIDRTNYYVGEIITFDDLSVTLVYSDGTKQAVNSVECEQLGRELNISDEALTIVYSSDEVKITTIIYINVEYGRSWEKLKTSKADYKYFTHYNTGDSISFGLLELFGDDAKGEFVYTENYDTNGLLNSAVVKGKYKIINGEIRFVSLSIFTNRSNTPRFYLNSEGDYFSAHFAANMAEITFLTGQFERNMFGHYVTEQNETSFSQTAGIVCFEKVDGENLSPRATDALAFYKSLIK